MQSMARKNEWPLDKMCLQCDVTKKNKDDFNSPPREGSFVHGLFMEGKQSNYILLSKQYQKPVNLNQEQCLISGDHMIKLYFVVVLFTTIYWLLHVHGL